MNDIIKWGIVGLGNVAYEFAKSFYNIKNAQLIAIASKTQTNLIKFKDDFNIDPKNCYNEYKNLLKNKDVDIVYLALPNSLHNEWISKSIDVDKNILVEKPAFTNINDAKLLFKNPKLKKIFLSEGFMFRYHPQIIKVIEIIKTNKIGKLVSMESFFGKNLLYKRNFFGFSKLKKIDNKKRIFNKNLGGGAILDHGSYTVSMSLLIASLIKGININNVKLNILSKKKIPGEVDIDSDAELNFDKKFTSYISASFLKDLGSKTIIIGDNGKIIINDTWNCQKCEIILHNKKNKIFKFKNKKNTYSLEIEKISEDILKNKKEASFPGTTKNEILISSQILDNWLNG